MVSQSKAQVLSTYYVGTMFPTFSLVLYGGKKNPAIPCKEETELRWHWCSEDIHIPKPNLMPLVMVRVTARVPMSVNLLKCVSQKL